MAESARLPDVVIVGAMKSATTSLYRWLDEQPEVFMAHPKETNFFTEQWQRGMSWYVQQFEQASSVQLLGEASVDYTSPEGAPIAAERMATVMPDVRIIYVVRHPVERIRSHYRHEVQRHRESRSLLDALREPGNTYSGNSSYGTCFQPYLDRFPSEQMLVIRFEDLVSPPAPAWSTTLRFLSLAERPAPMSAHNVSSEKRQFGWLFSWAWQRRAIKFSQIARLPAPVRRVGRLVFARGGAAYARKLEESRVPIPDEVLAPVWEDVERLETWLGADLWPRREETATSEHAR